MEVPEEFIYPLHKDIIRFKKDAIFPNSVNRDRRKKRKRKDPGRAESNRKVVKKEGEGLNSLNKEKQDQAHSGEL